MGLIETIIWGLVGGFGAEMTVFFGLRHTHPNDFPHWASSKTYYVIAGIMVLLGAGITVAQARSGNALTPLLAIQIGASAPLILRKVRETIPSGAAEPDPSKVD